MSSDKLILTMEHFRTELNVLAADEVGYAKLLEIIQKLDELIAANYSISACGSFL